jgi:hypothetical protein
MATLLPRRRAWLEPLIGNQYRSAFIEAMIEPYLAPHGWTYKGDGWSGWDFERTDGCRLEVKQSAARQTWPAPRNVQTRGALGIRTSMDVLRSAPVSAIHYSKNIPFTDYTSCSMVLNELARIDITKHLDIAHTTYRNEGHAKRSSAFSRTLML